MTTFHAAATTYLTKIAPTHTPSTMRTYQRNFDVVLSPYFGAETPITSITGTRVQEFLTSPEFLKKPNGQPRAEPTKDQISGLLRAFLMDAGITDLPVIARTRRTVERLCAKCRAPLTAETASTTEAAPQASATIPPEVTEQAPAPTTPPARSAATRQPKKAAARPVSKKKQRARK